MKRVRDFLREQEPSGPATFNTTAADYEDQGGEVTGGGRIKNYPLSASALRYLRNSGGAFSFGALSNYTESELNLILQGTSLSGSVIYSNRTSYDSLGERQIEEQNTASDYFTDVYTPAYNAHTAAVDALVEAGDTASLLRAIDLQNQWRDGPSESTEYDRLVAIYVATADQRSTILNNMISYIETGKINSYDPYGLDHPELAALELERKKREELERNIEASLKQLAKDNEALKSEGAKRNVLALVDLGFDIATAIAILNVFAGPGDELSLQALKQGVKQFFKKGTQSAVTKGYGQGISRGLVSQADDMITNLAMKKNSLGGAADDLIKQLDDAMFSGSDQQVRNILKQADDLITGRGITWTPKPRGSSGSGSGFRLGNAGTNPGGAFPRNSPMRQFKNSYESQGKVLTESHRKILREIKKPVNVPELPKKYKMNFSGKYSPQNTPDKTASQISDTLVASGNARGQRWRQKDKDWVGYETSERMNVVYDRVGHGDQYWNMIVSDNSRKKKDRELQEKLNIIAHEKALMQENPNYQTRFNQNSIDEQETLSADKDPLFKKVSNSLKKSIDYPDKPSKNGYPNDPPPKMIDGYHPDLVNGQRVSNYYNRLDPHSAEAMPPTGNPKIDANAKKALNAKQKARKIKNLRGRG